MPILVIPNIEVFGMSAHQNAAIIGTPSPVTICGASLALCRKLKVDFLSSAWVIHDFRLNEGHVKFVPHYASEKSASTSDIVTGDMRLSLLIQFARQDIPASDELSEPLQADMETFQNARLRRQAQRHICNIAGGRVIDPPAFDTIEIHEDEETALRAVRRYGGSILCDRSDLLEGYRDPLDGLLAHLAIPEDGATKPSSGWLVPIQVGFQSIEAATLRRADRNNQNEAIPHAFAECISSLGEYHNIRRVRSLAAYCWRYCHNPTERTYYVSAKPRP